jgi:hypothetical protein
VTPVFFKIWGDFYTETKSFIEEGLKPKGHRIFSLEKILGFVKEIYNHRWRLELAIEEAPDKEKIEYPPFQVFLLTQKSFREQMKSWYQNETISRKAVYDFYKSLEAYERTDQVVQIFCRHLSGHDDILWKYVYLGRQCISAKFEQDKIDMSQYRKYIEVMYPNRTVAKVTSLKPTSTWSLNSKHSARARCSARK